ncbi:hypothetical protein [Arhodomonas sp. AD133]|uniref:hypothetical protein n=1 Tax=Arhodomonas sp. AD133 TaxID=3415009 RepID=UPI003EBC24EA
MDGLPVHGKVDYSIRHEATMLDVDVMQTDSEDRRITYTPLSWNSHEPNVIVLDCSKGPTQAAVGTAFGADSRDMSRP